MILSRPCDIPIPCHLWVTTSLIQALVVLKFRYARRSCYLHDNLELLFRRYRSIIVLRL